MKPSSFSKNVLNQLKKQQETADSNKPYVKRTKKSEEKERKRGAFSCPDCGRLIFTAKQGFSKKLFRYDCQDNLGIEFKEHRCK